MEKWKKVKKPKFFKALKIGLYACNMFPQTRLRHESIRWDNKKKIIIFENQNIKLEVNMKDETVWLNTEQMAKLFDRDYKTIRKHINNALNEELIKEEVVAKFENITRHGAMNDKTQTHYIEYYNLDVIISVGYRVKSKKGVEFRKLANKILKDYMIKGYAINNKRLEY